MAVAQRLEGTCPVKSNKPTITSEVVERAIKDAERLLDSKVPRVPWIGSTQFCTATCEQFAMTRVFRIRRS